MLRERLIDQNTGPLLEVYKRMEDDLLRNIARRLQLTGAGDPDQWLVKKLLELGQLNAQNVHTIAKHSGHAYGKVAEAIERVAGGVIQANETVYLQAFNSGLLTSMPVPANASPTIRYILETAVKNAQNRINLINTTALQSAEQAFLNTINQAYLETITGTMNHRDAIARAVRALADDGITGANYISKAGRHTKNHIDVAVRRAVLTSTTQATGKAQIARAHDWGTDLVEVSSHASARPEHAEWQGQIYSLSGKHPKYKNFYDATGYGTGQGLHGYNCGHDFYPFIEGISEQRFQPYDEETTAENYKLKQEQRALEREIRKAEREEIVTRASGDYDGLSAAADRREQAQKEMEAFIESTGRTRRYDREDPVFYP